MSESEYVPERDESIMQSFKGLEIDGKWIMFFRLEIFDQKWKLACDLYREKKLDGVQSMEVATMKKTEGGIVPESAAIIFRCGHSSDKASMVKYGKKLVDIFQYSNPMGLLTYKADSYRGRKYNIPAPFGPSHDSYWDIEQNDDCIRKYGEPDGYWAMYFQTSAMDKKWKRACELFREGELEGISFMRRTCNIGSVGRSTKAFIHFLCGPSRDKSLMQKYGRNLMDKLQYIHYDGEMEFKFDEVRVVNKSGMRYTISVPTRK